MRRGNKHDNGHGGSHLVPPAFSPTWSKWAASRLKMCRRKLKYLCTIICEAVWKYMQLPSVRGCISFKQRKTHHRCACVSHFLRKKKSLQSDTSPQLIYSLYRKMCSTKIMFIKSFTALDGQDWTFNKGFFNARGRLYLSDLWSIKCLKGILKYKTHSG